VFTPSPLVAVLLQGLQVLGLARGGQGAQLLPRPWCSTQLHCLTAQHTYSN
jgi:hypothetical protein